MAKAKKMLSAVLAALMVVLSVASYVPAQAAKAVNVPKLQMVTQPEKEYKNGDRVSLTVTSPNYGGQVEYRVILWNGTTKKQSELWPTHKGYYYQNWKPAGSYKFTIHWPVEGMEPGAYSLTVLTRRANSKVAYDSFVKTEAFWVKNELAVDSIAALEDVTVDQGAEAKLPAEVTLNMTDKTTKTAKVTWEAVDTAKPGEYTVNGTVEGTDKKATVKVIVKEAVLKVESVSAIKATTLKVTFNKPVNDAKTSFEVKKNSIAVNVAKTEWSEDKMSANLTMVAKLSKGDYTVSVSTDTEKGVTGVATVEDEKVAKLELASDKLVITKDDMTEGKVGYVVYNQYGEDVTTKTSLFNIDWNVSPATGKSADKGVLTLTNTAKYQLDQKVVITALEKNTGYFMSATVTVSKKAYVNEVAIGEVKSDDAKITTLNVANIAHFFFPVTLKDQYGNVIKDKTAANAELLAIKANIDGAFDNDADGNLIFKLAPAVSQIAGKASLTFVTVNSGNRASKEFDIIANPAIADFTMELPEVIAAGDTKVPVKFSAVDQFGNAVTSVTDLTAALANLGVSGASLAKTDFTFAKDVKTGVISLTLNAQNATAGRVFITMLTPGNKVFTTNFEVKEARKPVVVSGINSKLITNYVVNSTGAIKSEDITILDQYGKAWSLKDLASTVKVNLTVSDATITTLSATELTGGDTNVAIVPKAKGTVTVTADIVGVSDSSYSFKLNVVEAKDVVSYEVADIATLNGNVGSTADIKVTGKLANGQEVALDYTVIKSIVSANTSVVTVDAAARKVTAVQNADVTLADATANVIVTIDGANGPVVVTKPVKVSYKKAAPAKIEADSENTNIVNGVAYVADTTDMKTLFVVTDQYGATLTDTLTIVKTGVTETGCDVTAITSNGLTAQLKVLYTK